MNSAAYPSRDQDAFGPAHSVIEMARKKLRGGQAEHREIAFRIDRVQAPRLFELLDGAKTVTEIMKDPTEERAHVHRIWVQGERLVCLRGWPLKGGKRALRVWRETKALVGTPASRRSTKPASRQRYRPSQRLAHPAASQHRLLNRVQSDVQFRH